MERVTVKICGVRTGEAAVAAVEGGADFVGLVFVPDSPRCVSVDEAQRVVAALDGRAQAVGVFRDETAERMMELIALAPLSRVQVHGASRQWADELAPMPCVAAVSFGDAIESELRALDRPENLAAILIDTPDPTQLGGGTGRTFDWAALRAVLDRVAPATPIILAGGLTPENVAQAIRVVRPWGVDVSSGVESSRGVKDIAKIRAFCEAVRLA